MRWFNIVAVLVVALVASGCGSDPTAEAPLFAELAATVTASVAATAEAKAPVTTEGPAPTEEPKSSEEDVVDEPVTPTSIDAALIDAELFPIVLGAIASPAGDGAFRFDVTLSSKYDSPQRYADAWRVLDADDNELGIRVLTHGHAGEQPFTRSATIEVPADVTVVFVEGRDQANGWSGQRFQFSLGDL